MVNETLPKPLCHRGTVNGFFDNTAPAKAGSACPRK